MQEMEKCSWWFIHHNHLWFFCSAAAGNSSFAVGDDSVHIPLHIIWGQWMFSCRCLHVWHGESIKSLINSLLWCWCVLIVLISPLVDYLIITACLKLILDLFICFLMTIPILDSVSGKTFMLWCLLMLAK